MQYLKNCTVNCTCFYWLLQTRTYFLKFQVTELSHLPPLSTPFGMTMDENFFYLSSNSFSRQSVYQVDKETGKNVKTVYQTGYSELGDLHVYKNITPPASKNLIDLPITGKEMNIMEEGLSQKFWMGYDIQRPQTIFMFSISCSFLLFTMKHLKFYKIQRIFDL